jgi:hypothetical protein
MLPRLLLCLGFRRSALRRGVDLVDGWLTLVFVAALVVVGPVIAWRSGQAVYNRGLNGARVSWGDYVQVKAVVQDDSIVRADLVDVAATARQVPVRLSWNGPDGVPHTGQLDMSAGRRAGTVVTIWTDAAGNLISNPPRLDQAISNGVGFGGFTMLGFSAVVVGIWLVARLLLDRLRLARWRAEWALVEPRWSGRQ